MWTADLPNGAEALKVKWDIVPYTRGQGLDLGCGPWKAFPHFIGLDNNKDERLFGYKAKADIVVPTCEKLPMFASESLDFVFSSHLLEHIEDYRSALKEWWRVIRPGGHLVLYLPHKDFYPNIGQPGANIDHKHDFLPSDISSAMRDLVYFESGQGWDLIVNEERNDGNEYSFFQVYKKLSCREVFFSYGYPKPEKTCAVIRYGAYGDVLQTASILPALKMQGYRITWYCTPRGHEVIKHDPHIDEFVIQDEDQVANYDLRAFFDSLKKRYTKLLNFCEAVEGVLLPSTDKSHYYWSKEARHAICNQNYVEFQHRMAEVPYYASRMRFYRTDAEKAWAKSERVKAGNKVVVWAVSGSAPHKVWVHVDEIIRKIVDNYDATVVLVGGENERFLEEGWSHRQVWRRCGEWSIRQALSFAQEADLVIGPETGLLNAMSMEPMHKIVFLSHSTIENLCRDWVNTTPFAGDAPCYPCHRLHTEGWRYCEKTELGAACQKAIKPGAVWRVVDEVLSSSDRIAA